MIEQKGKRNSAIIFADKIDKPTKTQIAAILRESAYADQKIRFMPDVHAGKYVPVGMTMTLGNQLSPTMLGADIGCGMDVSVISACDVDFQKLDTLVRAQIPCGAKIHQKPVKSYGFENLLCKARIDVQRACCSLGTLGGGNHFIELDRCADGKILLVIHTGSRQLGSDVMQVYQKIAVRETYKRERKKICHEERDSCGVYREKQREKSVKVHAESALLKGDCFLDYLHDVSILTDFADCNRRTIAETICDAMHFEVLEHFSCVHNYIDTEHGILRKGAISARMGERVVIPLNMRDGVILGVGRGNNDWNFSAPHGAGRVCNRQDAKYVFSVEEFQKEMLGIYTTTANAGSLDECPLAYKAPERIIPFLTETVEISEIAKPIYNYKAC